MKNKIQVKIIVQGMVQGVFFRASTQKAAQKLRISGWVKNMPDRTVHALFQGNSTAVAQMIDWCRQGPPDSRVDHVHTENQHLETAVDSFEIHY